MDCGKLRSYANIETFVKTGNSTNRGNPLGNWTTLYTSVPMAVVELDGRQAELARQLVATATHKITLRYIAGLMPLTMRVNYGGKLLKIESTNEGDHRHLYLTLLCSEQINGAA